MLRFILKMSGFCAVTSARSDQLNLEEEETQVVVPNPNSNSWLDGSPNGLDGIQQLLQKLTRDPSYRSKQMHANVEKVEHFRDEITAKL